MFRRIAVAGAALTLAASPVLAQEGMDPEAMMKAWMESAKPGANHEKLTAMAGNWNVEVTSYDDPSGPKTTQGTAVMKPLLGGRFIQEEVTGEMMGMPFHGIGIYGYNNGTKKFEMTWLDDMGTMMLHGEGEMKDGAVTFMMEFVEPMMGQTVMAKGVSTFDDKDKHTYTMYMLMDGQEHKSMEAVYTRKK